MGGVTARSDWSTSATFMSFIAGPYINYPAAGHESFDKGSPAFERNKNPLLVNPAAWLSHEPNGDPGWTVTYDDRFGNAADHSIGNRILNNTFQVRQVSAQGAILQTYDQLAAQRSDSARTNVSRYEDGGSHMLAVGQNLEDMYRSYGNVCGTVKQVTSLSRQIVYLRPSQFIVYDRSSICSTSRDQYLAFHFPANPLEVTPPAPGVHRFDVTTGQFAGSMTTILPANAAVAKTDRFSSDTRTRNKLLRTEIRPTDTPATTRSWLTVFDLAPSSSQVAAATPVSLISGPAVGVLLQAAAGNSVVSGTAQVGTAIAGTLGYVVPAAQTRHVVTDLTPSAGYTISVSTFGGNHNVTIAPGSDSNATAKGVLTFQVNASGQVTQ
jgi:hypothetical protein